MPALPNHPWLAPARADKTPAFLPSWSAFADAAAHTLCVMLCMLVVWGVSARLVFHSSAPAFLGDADIFVRLSHSEREYEVDAPFLPLYPLLIRVFAPLCLGSPLFSALAVSFAGTVCGVYAVQRIAAPIIGPDAARRAAWYALLSPVSFFLLNGYSEGVFFGLSAWALLQGRRGHWQSAGVLGSLACLTRLSGGLLLPALLIEWVQQVRRGEIGICWEDAAAMSLIPLAILYVLLTRGGDIGAPLHILRIEHTLYGREWAFPWVGAAKTLTACVNGRWALRAGNWSAALYGLGWPALLVAGARWIPASLWVYLLAGMVFLCNVAPSQPVPWWSLDRFLMVLFPAYIALGRMPWCDRAHRCLMGLSLIMLVLQWALFVNGCFG